MAIESAKVYGACNPTARQAILDKDTFKHRAAEVVRMVEALHV